MNTSARKGRYETNDVRSSGETAHDIISGKILSGELPPGEKLSVRSMAKLTGVSVIPVIEALHRLEFEGLVESFPRWGSRVVALSPETIRDRNALREAIECQAVRLLAESGLTKEQENRLQFLASELDATPRTDERDSVFWNRHYEFHIALAEYTACSSLVKSLHFVSLFHLLQRIILSKRELFSRIPGDLHTKIVAAILDRNPDEAERAMRDHIRLSSLTASKIV